MPGGVITTGSHPKALWPGIHAFWGQIYEAHQTEYTDLYSVEDSGKSYEEDVQITGFGLAPFKAEGAPISYDWEIQGAVQRYTHLAYALGYKVTFEELRDNLYEVISMRRARANAFSIAQTLENIGASVYNDAFTGAVFTTKLFWQSSKTTLTWTKRRPCFPRPSPSTRASSRPLSTRTMPQTPSCEDSPCTRPTRNCSRRPSRQSPTKAAHSSDPSSMDDAMNGLGHIARESSA